MGFFSKSRVHHTPKSEIKADIKEAKARTTRSTPFTSGQMGLQKYLERMATPGTKEYDKASLSSNPIYQQATSLLNSILNPSKERMAMNQAPAMRQFREEIAPEIAQRYASAGLGNSTSFQNAMAEAGAGLSERLYGQQIAQQENALSNALGYAQAPYEQDMMRQQIAMNKAPYQFGYVGKNKSGQSIMQSVFPALMEAGGAFAGSYAGNTKGGYDAGKAFADRVQPNAGLKQYGTVTNNMGTF